MAATLLAIGMDPREYAPVFIDAARDTRRRPLRSLTPGFYPVQCAMPWRCLRATMRALFKFRVVCGRYVHDAMMAELPGDAHLRCNGRLLVSLSVRTPGQRAPFVNRLISHYPSRAFLADALSAACWIPGLTGGLLKLPRLGDETGHGRHAHGDAGARAP